MSRWKTRETILRTEILKAYKIVPSRLPGGPGPPPCIALVQESTSPPVFLKRKPADHPGCLGGHPLSVSLRPFSTRRKDVAAQPISFLEGLRFYARTNHNARPFQVWPEGHLLSSHEESRQRRAKGSSLGAPGNFVDFLFRKIDLNAATLSTDIKKGLRPRAWSSCLFSAPRPP